MSAKKNISILLLDNVTIERELITEILVHIGCSVTAVTDRQECIHEFKRSRYDLVLFDQYTLGVDLTAFIERLDEINQLTPIAMMGTVYNEGYADRFTDSTIDFILTKPFGYDQLSKLVEETIEFSKRLMKTKPYKQAS